MAKKVLAASLILVLAVALSGCTQPAVDEPNQDSQPNQGTQPQSPQQPKSPPEVEPGPDSELMNQAVKEKNPDLCQQIQDQQMIETCVAWASQG